uniref:Peptidase C58 YopT-type domain-containing protein n=1 Tax=viral metagenome TaxID=1070528 RepID=A0A6C0ADI9_9ZZZZ
MSIQYIFFEFLSVLFCVLIINFFNIIIKNYKNIQEHSEKIKRFSQYIKNYKQTRDKKVYKKLHSNKIIVLKSKNFLDFKNLEFSQNIYLKIYKYIIFFDYIYNLDILFKDFNNINYLICKRKFEIYRLEGFCLGMSIKFVKEILTNNLEFIDFSQGPDDESISYQLLSELDMITPKQYLYSFMCSINKKLFSELFYLELFKLLGINIIKYVEKKLNNGIYLNYIYINENIFHMVVIKKEKNNYLFFDPNVGLLKLENINQIKKLIKNNYNSDNLNLYKVY